MFMARRLWRKFNAGLLLFSHPVMSDSLWPHGLQHIRPPCPSLSPGVCPSSCSLQRWCRPAISSSDALFSFCPQSFPALGTFPMNHLFISDDQNTGASASVLPVNIRGWSPLRLTGLISLLQLSGVYSSATVQSHQLLAEQCLCFSAHCLGLSSLSCQEAIVFWFHGCSHCPQWFWSPRRGNFSLLSPFPLLFAMQ